MLHTSIGQPQKSPGKAVRTNLWPEAATPQNCRNSKPASNTPRDPDSSSTSPIERPRSFLRHHPPTFALRSLSCFPKSAIMLSRQVLRSMRSAAPRVSQPTRAFASATDSVKPPVAVYGLDGTYATALVRLSPVPDCTAPNPTEPRQLLWFSQPELVLPITNSTNRATPSRTTLSLTNAFISSPPNSTPRQ
jgi:hypothetical protein